MDTYVLGVDAGGSHTRALLANLTGVPVAAGRAGGANPVSRGVDGALVELRRAVGAAVGGIDPAAVAVCVVGIAGGPTLGRPFRVALDQMAADLGLRRGCTLVSDTEIGFAAGTSADHGILVLAGTGAAVAEIRAGRLTRHVDGYGWLLGDDGSGFWLGREAVRAALAELDGRGAATALTGRVAAALGVEPAVDPLVAAVYASPPVQLARLAPQVTAAAEGGDAVAAELLERAAGHLLRAVAVLDPRDHRQAVLTGGVLLARGVIADLVVAGLRDRFGLASAFGVNGAAGAAALALRLLTGRPVPPDVHARLTAD